MEVLRENPFVVLTPDSTGKDTEIEITNAETIHKLFVNVFEDFTSIPQQGHVFLNGPRGSGKSMMFRFLLPSCQLIDKNVKNYDELPFFSFHIPIKLTSINNPEFELIKEYGNNIFNEHVMTIYFSEFIFDSLTKLNFNHINHNKIIEEIRIFYNDSFLRKLKQCGWTLDPHLTNFIPDTVQNAFIRMKNICSDILVDAQQFLKRNVVNYKSLDYVSIPYYGPLCDYLSFLFPLLKELKNISIFPKKPFFLLIDDADNLTESQTMVLNSWVSYRTNSEVSLKISTQLNYKTFNTVNGTNIDSPHDYFDINILTVYSSAKNIYNKRIRQIVQKRLDFFFKDVKIKPELFFPVNKEQEEEIEKEKQKIKDNYPFKKKGYRESDDVQRYAIPNYIKKLKGISKSGYTYSFSGFDQLVSISSGIIRHFLTPAAWMFNAEFRNLKLRYPDSKQTDIKSISTSIQNDEIRAYSTRQLFEEYDKLRKDIFMIKRDSLYLTKIDKLRNLIEGLGTLFHSYLLDENRSERKIFSFAVSGNPHNELLEVIELGVRFGYFHKSTIGKKSGYGRTTLYILNRILAPHFLLDPTSFAGYKFFTSDKLMKSLVNPEAFRQEMIKFSEKEEKNEFSQLELEFIEFIEI